MSLRKLALLTLPLLALPSIARADMGTPLMWASFLHLWLGNTVLGVVEGMLLARVFCLKKWKCVGLSIAANYFSAWVGSVFLAGAIVRAIPIHLYNLRAVFCSMVLITYLLTLILEWPFVALCFRGSSAWLKRSVIGSVLVNTATYVLLVGWYWLASETSLFTNTKIVALSDMPLSRQVLLFFISDRDGAVYCRALPGSVDKKIFDLKSSDSWDRLRLLRSSTNPKRWDLVARKGTGSGEPILLGKWFSLAARGWAVSGQGVPLDEAPATCEPVPRLGSAADRAWEFQPPCADDEGLSGTNSKTGAHIRLSLVTPFVAWGVENAMQLPNDEVIFQLGDNQICILEPNTKRIALVARGRSPIAVIPDSDSESATFKPGRWRADPTGGNTPGCVRRPS